MGIGSSLPPTIRTNDYWPESVLERWRQKNMHAVEAAAIEITPGVQSALDAMARYKNDLFNGAIERHIMADGQLSSEMETEAAKRAIADAAIDKSEIDAVFSFTVCPDYLCAPTGCLVHKNVGLSPECMTFNLEAACNSFISQLALADQMIRAGNARYVLLTQSAGFSRLVPMESPLSPWVGDGATAVVVGPVANPRGVLAYTHITDGTRNKAVVIGVPGKRWYEDGRVVGYSEDRAMAQSQILGSIDRAKEVIPKTLKKAGLAPTDIQFFACHQGVPWLREVVQDVIGMKNARWIDTYKVLGSISAANIPMVMSIGKSEKLLRDDDLVMTFSGGSGETSSAAVLRWGNG